MCLFYIRIKYQSYEITLKSRGLICFSSYFIFLADINNSFGCRLKMFVLNSNKTKNCKNCVPLFLTPFSTLAIYNGSGYFAEWKKCFERDNDLVSH